MVKQIYNDYDNIGATLEANGTYTFDAKALGNPLGSTLNFGDQNVEALAKQLLEKYKGRNLTARRLFDEHHVNNKWCATHYAQTLRELVNRGQLRANFTDNVTHRVSVTITEQCQLEFI